MRFRIDITELDEETGNEIPRYTQIVDAIDMLTVINAVNSNAERRRAQRSDAGKPRRKEEEVV